jgi:hypothetical protein
MDLSRQLNLIFPQSRPCTRRPLPHRTPQLPLPPPAHPAPPVLDDVDIKQPGPSPRRRTKTNLNLHSLKRLILPMAVLNILIGARPSRGRRSQAPTSILIPAVARTSGH